MKTSLFRYHNNTWELNKGSIVFEDSLAQLVLCFAARELLHLEENYTEIKRKFPLAEIALCSTAGEILQDEVLDNSFIVTAIHFENTPIQACSVNISAFENSFSAGVELAKKMPQHGLRYVLVLSDGSLVNGSELVKGLGAHFHKDVLITGGLAGDRPHFRSTLVGLNNKPLEGEVLAVGFYGNSIKVTHGSRGGWEMFGLEKRVTKSNANILEELGEQNALELYKKYLGPHSEGLPGTALLFPLAVTLPGEQKPVVRTILSINEKDGTMVFAGDVPVGARVRFMKSKEEWLTSAASEAAAIASLEDRHPDYSLLISCVGRRLVLGNNSDKEVLAVGRAFHEKTLISGFYSYGEITPFNEGGKCQLHNQTMTITSFYEN